MKEKDNLEWQDSSHVINIGDYVILGIVILFSISTLSLLIFSKD